MSRLKGFLGGMTLEATLIGLTYRPEQIPNSALGTLPPLVLVAADLVYLTLAAPEPRFPDLLPPWAWCLDLGKIIGSLASLH